MMAVNCKHETIGFFPILVRKMTLKELLCGANSDAKIMFQKAKSKGSVNIHHTERVLQKNNISSRSFLLNMMEEILFYMTKTLKQETLGSISVPSGTTSIETKKVTIFL